MALLPGGMGTLGGTPGPLIPSQIGSMGGTVPTGGNLAPGSASGSIPFTGGGPTSTSLLSGVHTSLNSSSPTGGQVNLSPAMSWGAHPQYFQSPAANVNGAQPGSTVYGGGTGAPLKVDSSGNVTLPNGQTMTAAQYQAYGSNYNPGASDIAYTNTMRTGASGSQSAVGRWINGQWQPETNPYALQDWAKNIGTSPSNLVNPSGGSAALSNGWNASAPTSGSAAASGVMGTGGMNSASHPAVTGSTQTPIGAPTSSNAGGDIHGTMNALPTPTPSLIPTNTSPSAYLAQPVTAGQLGPQQPVATPPAYTAAGSKGDFAQGTNWNVTPSQTVAGQYTQLMSGANPAIQAAEAATTRAYAAHGGSNDLMAQNAAAMQGSQLALQIASQDAQTNAAAGQYNANVANQFATNLNSFVQNSMLSTQNFQQGISMLSAQTNQQLQLMSAQLNSNAIQAGININSFAQQTQIGLNATLQQMNAQYGMTLGQMGYGAAISSAQAWQQYGMNVRLNYLGNVAQQQAALMNTIATIQTNPNITSSQAASAMQSAINEFNAFMTQYSAYSAAMMPSSATAAPNGTYNNSNYEYGYINPGWPSPTGPTTGSNVTLNNGIPTGAPNTGAAAGTGTVTDTPTSTLIPMGAGGTNPQGRPIVGVGPRGY